MKVQLVILGEPASKANSRQIVMMGRGPNARPSSIKSQKARDYEAAAQVQIPSAARVMMRGPVKVTMRIFYASERPDLDASIVLDVLQAKWSKLVEGQERRLERAGVYANDRQVREMHLYHAISRANPRTEIEVEEIVSGLFDELAPPLVSERVKRSPKRAKLEHFIATGENPF